jgi:uncharacterized protein YbjQ (UPF0145 family)
VIKRGISSVKFDGIEDYNRKNSKMKCKECSTETEWKNLEMGRCPKCYEQYLSQKASVTPGEKAQKEANEREHAADQETRRLKRLNLPQTIRNMILTTEASHSLPVRERLDIVTTEVVAGMNVFKDFAAGIRNLVGGRSVTVQNAFKDIRKDALAQLKREAAELGADAVVGVSLSYLDIAATGSTMLVVIATGTAVTLDKKRDKPSNLASSPPLQD